MPSIRDYPQASEVNLTDAFMIDQLGIGTRWCTAQQILDLIGPGPYNIAMGYSSAPPPNTTFLAFIANSEFGMPINLEGSVAEFITAPSSPVVLSVQKNGTQFGTISFPSGSNGGSVGVFAGSAETFAEGDLLEIMSPGSLYGAANLAVTFAGTLTS